MADYSDIDDGPESLPLKLAYSFLSEKGFVREADDIKTSKDKYKSYSSTLRRGKIIDLLEKNNLLNEFTDKYWQNAKTETGKSKIRSYKNIFNGFMDNIDREDEKEIDEAEDSSFAYESDLRDYIAKNLSIIEAGLELFFDNNGKDGIEYSVDSNNKRIDILAIDKNNTPVVIELKVSQGYEKVIGQTLYYRNKIKELMKTNDARVIIIAKEITERLKKAVEDLSFVELYEYSLFVSLKRV